MGRKKTISDADLLDRARQIFVARGFAVSTKEVASHVGVSEGVLFQRYGTKEELFFASMVLPVPDLAGGSRGAREDALSRLDELTMRLVEYFRETMPVLLPVVAHPGFRFEEFAARHPDSPLGVLRRNLMTFFVQEKAAGRIGEVEPGAAALIILSVAQSVAFFEQMGAHHGRFPSSILKGAVHCLWQGLAPGA